MAQDTLVAPPTDHHLFTMDGSTQGGVVGDEVIFRDIKADVWQVIAHLQQSGTEATPFSSAA